MKKAIIPTAILCTAICIGLHTQPNRAEEINPTPEPPQVEVTATPVVETEPESIVIEPETEEFVIEVVISEPTPEPTTQQEVSNQSVQAGDMVYVPGFGGSKARAKVQ